jgi:hypothetical protein
MAIKLDADYAEAYISRGNAKLALDSRAGAEQDWARAERIKAKKFGGSELMKPAVG